MIKAYVSTYNMYKLIGIVRINSPINNILVEPEVIVNPIAQSMVTRKFTVLIIPRFFLNIHKTSVVVHVGMIVDDILNTKNKNYSKIFNSKVKST